MISNETALRECPFCPDGGKPKLTYAKGFGFEQIDKSLAMVGCDECGVISPYAPTDKAIAAWNTRIARTPADGPEPVAVKALEWRYFAGAFPIAWDAETQWGRYSVEERWGPNVEPPDWHQDVDSKWALSFGVQLVGIYASLDAAKAAAQANYETRIRSAITHPVPADGPADAVSEAEVPEAFISEFMAHRHFWAAKDMDIVARKDGKEYRLEADWLKPFIRQRARK